MIKRWLCRSAAVLVLSAVVAAPAEAAVPGPVGRDPRCAAALLDRAGPVRVLGCDAAGRGLAVVALGEPATAAHVAVLVPGADTDLDRLADAADPRSRPLGWARDLAAAGGGDLAVVVWLGYVTPEGLGPDAASGRLARAGAAALVRFLLDLDTEAHLTLIGHSYGAVVVALAAPYAAVDDLVLLGSPGARADDVTGLRTPARVWAARAAGDWTAWIPPVRIGDLGHGADPASPGFGARALPVGGTSGHDGYFRPGSAALAGLADVALGRVPSDSRAEAAAPRGQGR
jgi:Alpha/beta hydrolase